MKNLSRFLRDQLVMAKHHVNDAEAAPNQAVLKSSLKDTDELLDRMRTVLPVQDQVSVAAEGNRKEASLADVHRQRNMPNKELTMTRSEMLKQAADAEAVDRANAFECGFARAAQDAGFTEAQYQHMRKIAIAQLQKQAEMQNKAQPATNETLGKGIDAPQQEKPEKGTKKLPKGDAKSGITGRGCK